MFGPKALPIPAWGAAPGNRAEDFEAVAVRGMQELQAENAALRARLDAIEAKLAAQR